MTTSNELTDFVQKAKFKVSGTGTFTYFNPTENTQIRIQTNGHKSHFKRYQVTLHERDNDGITFKPYIQNITAFTLKEAKLEAAKMYFQLIAA